MTTEKTVPASLYAELWRYVLPDAVFDEEGNVEPEGDAESPFSGGYPSSVYEMDPDWVWVWAEDFTPEQEAEWDDIVKRARRRTEPMPPLQDEWDAMRAYYNAPSPTEAQTVTTLKAVIKVLREQYKEED